MTHGFRLLCCEKPMVFNEKEQLTLMQYETTYVCEKCQRRIAIPRTVTLPHRQGVVSGFSYNPKSVNPWLRVPSPSRLYK